MANTSADERNAAGECRTEELIAKGSHRNINGGSYDNAIHWPIRLDWRWT